MVASLGALWQVGTTQCFLSQPDAGPPFVVEVRDGTTVQSRYEFSDHWDACAHVWPAEQSEKGRTPFCHRDDLPSACATCCISPESISHLCSDMSAGLIG